MTWVDLAWVESGKIAFSQWEFCELATSSEFQHFSRPIDLECVDVCCVVSPVCHDENSFAVWEIRLTLACGRTMCVFAGHTPYTATYGMIVHVRSCRMTIAVRLELPCATHPHQDYLGYPKARACESYARERSGYSQGHYDPHRHHHLRMCCVSPRNILVLT